jgi:hypothetical protein
LLAVSVALIACAPHRQAFPQGSRPTDARASAASDSAVYAAFFETVNRDPQRDTIYVEQLSAVFHGASPHYDSVAPGLAQALQKASALRRPTTSLHLPPPIRILPDSAVKRIGNADLLGTLGAVKGRAQGPLGLWAFSPIVYSGDGTDAMFYYSEYCGQTCGENTLVWLRKDSDGKWAVRRTAILVIY